MINITLYPRARICTQGFSFYTNIQVFLVVYLVHSVPLLSSPIKRSMELTGIKELLSAPIYPSSGCLLDSLFLSVFTNQTQHVDEDVDDIVVQSHY